MSPHRSWRRLLAVAVVALALAAGSGVTPVAGTGERVHGPSGGGSTDVPASTATNLTYEGDTLTVAAGPGQVITGRTDLPAGTTLRVRAQSTGGEQPFVRSVSAVVDRHGRFRAVLGFSAYEPGAEFRVVVRYNGTTLTEAPAVFEACAAACESPTATDPRAGTTLSTVGERRPLARTAGSVVEGNTTLAPGTSVTVRLNFSDDVRTRTVETAVAADGSFRAVVDVSQVPDGTPFRVTVVHEGRTLAAAPGTVVDCEGPCDWSTGATPSRTVTFTFDARGAVTPTSGGDRFAGLGALALGGTLAVVGIALLLGVGRV